MKCVLFSLAQTAGVLSLSEEKAGQSFDYLLSAKAPSTSPTRFLKCLYFFGLAAILLRALPSPEMVRRPNRSPISVSE